MKTNLTLPHIPVLLEEVITGLNIKKDGTYLDLTLGRGGHSNEILKRLTAGQLIGIDQDDEAINYCQDKFSSINSRFLLVRDNFQNIDAILDNLKIDKVDGILMDLGVSSPQFDDPKRGFSYRSEAVLDMRMNQQQKLTASEIVNTYSLDDLAKIFREYGEEPYAYQISKNIVKEREKGPINTTSQLIEIIKRSKPSKELAKPGHPAKQAFQALRIAVNDEINVLVDTLPKVCNRLKSGGRLAIITFHSGEDRVVKKYFQELTIAKGNRLNIPEKEKPLFFRLVNTHPIIASEEELTLNHRAKSAKLRIIEKK